MPEINALTVGFALALVFIIGPAIYIGWIVLSHRLAVRRANRRSRLPRCSHPDWRLDIPARRATRETLTLQFYDAVEDAGRRPCRG